MVSVLVLQAFREELSADFADRHVSAGPEAEGGCSLIHEHVETSECGQACAARHPDELCRTWFVYRVRDDQIPVEKGFVRDEAAVAVGSHAHWRGVYEETGV